MTRRERLMATLEGKPVDRPPVSFYEINGHDESRSGASRFNIFSDPSWHPVLDLARDRSDRILMRGVLFKDVLPDPISHLATSRSWEDGGRLYTEQTIRAPGRTLTSHSMRDPDMNTVWTTEHLIKGVDDLRAYLGIATSSPPREPDVAGILALEEELGDTGIVMVDTPDPLCLAAGLFHMEDLVVLSLTERRWFSQLVERFAEDLLPRTAAIARALPGRLWRIYGPEYAAAPYMRPELFHDYVTTYVRPMVRSIQRYGGFARVHCHGRIRGILGEIEAINPDGLDPIEPPPQGDIQLREVRERIGATTVLFGNIEESDIETLPTHEFGEKVKRAIDEGVGGRGFVLMPSSCPASRTISPLVVANYEKMVEIVEGM